MTNTPLAFILDLDGTLVETEGLKALSYAHAAELQPNLGEAEVVDAFKDFVCRSRRNVTTGLLRHFGLEETARSRMTEFGVKTPWQAYVRVRLHICDALLSAWSLILTHRYPHNIALLHDLRGPGYETRLSTMWHTEQARRVMSILGLTDAVDAIATRDDVENGKPDPEMDLLVAHELRARPEDCLVIEDSPAGGAAARGARQRGGRGSAGGRQGRERRHHRAHPPEVPRHRPLGPQPRRGRPAYAVQGGAPTHHRPWPAPGRLSESTPSAAGPLATPGVQTTRYHHQVFGEVNDHV